MATMTPINHVWVFTNNGPIKKQPKNNNRTSSTESILGLFGVCKFRKKEDGGSPVHLKRMGDATKNIQQQTTRNEHVDELILFFSNQSGKRRKY
mmetsp:Transcript_18874/g.39105  ORF Transcript_18874/g.39105 Transcript_18874/m.39105 type:complete len:94 (-) Transcript_18874:12-293(-)